MNTMLKIFSTVSVLLHIQSIPDVRAGEMPGLPDPRSWTKEWRNYMQRLMSNRGMCGGDMAGGMVDGQCDSNSAVAGFLPNSRFTFWTNGIVYYEYNATSATYYNQSIVDQAIAEIESKTCVRFRQRNGNTSIISYISIQSTPAGCWSVVGMDKQGPTVLNLEEPGCWYKGTVIHEIMHAMGFKHEHQRYDRDSFIYVNFTNVIAGQESQFNLVAQSSTYPIGILAYNMDSIMHYENTAFGKTDGSGRPLWTIFPIVNRTITHVAERPFLSDLDAQMVNLIYQNFCSSANVSPGTTVTTTTLTTTKPTTTTVTTTTKPTTTAQTTTTKTTTKASTTSTRTTTKTTAKTHTTTTILKLQLVASYFGRFLRFLMG